MLARCLLAVRHADKCLVVHSRASPLQLATPVGPASGMVI